MRLRPEQDALFADREAGTERADNRFALWPTLSWFAGLLVATALVGFILHLQGFCWRSSGGAPGRLGAQSAAVRHWHFVHVFHGLAAES